MKRRVIEIIIRLSMAGLRYAVSWRMRKLGYKLKGHTWSKDREHITPSDPQVSVSVHDKNAVIELVNAASSVIYRNN